MAQQPDNRDEILEGEVIDASPSNRVNKNSPQGDSGRLVAAAFSRLETHSGPLPHPDVLRSYEDIMPGAADRIFKMAEKQSDHRQELEKAVIQNGIRASRRGTYCALAINIVGFGLAGYLGYLALGYPAVAVVLTNVAGSVGVFALGRQKQRQELQEKQKEIESAPKRPAPKRVKSTPEQ